MTNEMTAPAQIARPANAEDDSLGIDREFLMQMARMPLLALAWVAAAAAASLIWHWIEPSGPNFAPLIVICAGMILAAFIDGWAFKVPNWVTLPLVLSGWMIGLCHDAGVSIDSGSGGFGTALLCTGIGFILLFPMLAIGGVGEGDVKMQMGFGSWIGAYFGADNGATGILFWAFCFGAIIGGLFGLIMILLRRQFKNNAATVGEILMDFQLFASGSTGQATKRAHDRRKTWVKIPYGIPLCVGFLLFLWYRFVLNA
jgi:prepilin peptidase CpaA